MRWHGALVLLLVGSLTACSGITDPSSNRIEDFSGVVPLGGNGPVHSFRVDKNGELIVTLTALAPDPTINIGAALGQPSGDVCNPIVGAVNDVALLNRQILGGAINKGLYCIVMYDPAALTTPQTYTIRVSHP
jgi:hypothetical protein